MFVPVFCEILATYLFVQDDNLATLHDQDFYGQRVAEIFSTALLIISGVSGN
jgi:hypothetical protein